MEKEQTNIYPYPYAVREGCLCIETASNGYRKLCTFAPRMLSEIAMDDGQEVTRYYSIGGTDEQGRELPPVKVPASELEKMNWMKSSWPAFCSLCVVNMAERHVAYAIRQTAGSAPQKLIFTHTGWKQIDGQWEFLLPGNENFDVQLQGKQRSYCAANAFEEQDLCYLAVFLDSGFIPLEILYPCLALVFLSPLNSFLRKIGHEPKFILALIGRTGSMKSTIAALMLSFFGNFSETDLPMSFRDTANSIIYSSFALKDVLTCIDDYHPASTLEGKKMLDTMQAVARAYGDRAARNRMTSEITLRDSRPPQGNAIVTAEFLPDIGESGTARLFYITMEPGQLDLKLLTDVQGLASDGLLRRCMFAYLQWLKSVYLCSEAAQQVLERKLKEAYQHHRLGWRQTLQKQNLAFHNRLPDTLTCLQIGFEFLLAFLKAHAMLTDEDAKRHKTAFLHILLDHARKQSEAVQRDKPSHIYIRKLMVLLDCGQLQLIPCRDHPDIHPLNHAGYEDEEFYFLFFDFTHKAVKKFCNEQGEEFPISSAALGKQLAEDGFIDQRSDKGTTQSIRFYGRNRRVMILRKDRVQALMGV